MNTLLKTIFTLLIGIGTGLVTGYFTAPRSGKKSREKLVTDINSTKNEIEQAALRKLEEAKVILNESVESQKAKSKKAIDIAAEALKVS